MHGVEIEDRSYASRNLWLHTFGSNTEIHNGKESSYHDAILTVDQLRGVANETLERTKQQIYFNQPLIWNTRTLDCMLRCWRKKKKLTLSHRSSHRIPGHWPPSAVGGKPSAKAVQDENLCTKHRGRKVSFLVLLNEVAKGQEGEWRDRVLERGRFH